MSPRRVHGIRSSLRAVNVKTTHPSLSWIKPGAGLASWWDEDRQTTLRGLRGAA